MQRQLLAAKKRKAPWLILILAAAVGVPSLSLFVGLALYGLWPRLTKRGGSAAAPAGHAADNRLEAPGGVWEEDGFELSVRDAQVREVPLRIGNLEDVSSRPHLVLTLRARNLRRDRHVDYEFWASQNEPIYRGRRAVVADNFGNQHRYTTFGVGWKVKGVASDTRLPPGYDGETVIVCDVPLPQAEYLDIDLPAPDGGCAYFRLPAGAVGRWPSQ